MDARRGLDVDLLMRSRDTGLCGIATDLTVLDIILLLFCNVYGADVFVVTRPTIVALLGDRAIDCKLAFKGRGVEISTDG